MSWLLVINALMMLPTGVLFALFGNNLQSRTFGVIQVAVGVLNLYFLVSLLS